MVALLRHPNIVQIYDIGEVEGQPFLALEYAEGGSLRERLAGAPMAPRAAVLLLEPLARAVQHAHRQGVIHRDLKPANILLAVTGDSIAEGNRPLPDRGPRDEFAYAPAMSAPITACSPKLTDFGLAQLFDSDIPGSDPGVAAGTPSYMSPEQAGAGAIGAAVDIWALGANLYELLTGRPPFRAATAIETLRLVLTTDPIPPRELPRPSVPRDLDTICMKCLREEPGPALPRLAPRTGPRPALLPGRRTHPRSTSGTLGADVEMGAAAAAHRRAAGCCPGDGPDRLHRHPDPADLRAWLDWGMIEEVTVGFFGSAPAFTAQGRSWASISASPNNL